SALVIEFTDWKFSFNSNNSDFATFISSLSLEKVKNVTLDIDIVLEVSIGHFALFEVLSSSLTSLTSMHLKQPDSAYTFIVYMIGRGQRDVSRGCYVYNAVTQFPRLSEITFNGITYRDANDKKCRYDYSVVERDMLMFFLTQRSQYMRPIRILEFQNVYDMTPKKLQDLENIVPCVEKTISDKDSDKD
ncbi:hypothetical protein CVT24_013229, partial [Panaeolus cyanescens]